MRGLCVLQDHAQKQIDRCRHPHVLQYRQQLAGMHTSRESQFADRKGALERVAGRLTAPTQWPRDIQEATWRSRGTS